MQTDVANAMEHLVCALFDDEPHASDAVERLLQSGVSRSVIGAALHEGELVHEDMPHAGEQSVRRGLTGAAIGGTLGALLGGIVVGPIGLIGAGGAAIALFLAGSMYGGIAGAISGRDDDKPEVKKLAEKLEPGKVMVTVDVSGAVDVDAVEAILAHSGGRRVQLA